MKSWKVKNKTFLSLKRAHVCALTDAGTEPITSYDLFASSEKSVSCQKESISHAARRPLMKAPATCNTDKLRVGT